MGPKRNREPEVGNRTDLKRSKTVFPKNTVPKTPRVNIAENLKVSCRPNGLVNLVQQLGPNQRKAVIDIGFGSLLDFRVKSLPLRVIPLFLKHFNAAAHIFQAKDIKFFLSKDDVYDVFGLPYGGDKVEVVSTGHNLLSSQETLKDEFRKKFNVEGTNYVTVPAVYNAIINMGDDGGDEFRRLFVLYAMSIVLAPPSNYAIDFSILKAVQDVSRIRHLDWCDYVFDKLVNAVERCRTGSATLRGCILVVMVAYFHRTSFKEETMSSETPLIKHWDETSFNKRGILEFNSGSLGNGEYINGVYPVCKRLREAKAAELRSVIVVDKPEPGKRYMELPDCFDTDDGIRAKAADVSQAHLLMMKRDVEIFLHLYMQRKEGIEKERGSSSVEDSSTATLVSSTPAFISDDNSLFIKYFNFICEKAEEMKQAGSKLPLYESFCNEHEKGKETRKEGLVLDPEKYKVVYHREKGKNKIVDLPFEKPNEEETNNVSIQNKDDEGEAVDLGNLDGVVNKVVSGSVFVGRIQDNSFINSYLLHSAVMPEHTFFGNYGIGCGLACGLPDPDAVVVSKFLCEYKELFAPILKLRKNVLDYCFLHDHDLRIGEDLVVFSFHNMLTRDDIISLSAKTMITSNVIDSWSFLLNDMLFKAGKGLSPSRSFFCTSHSASLFKLINAADDEKELYRKEIFSTWDTVIENSQGSLDIGADLVFIPVHYGLHFFCVAVNFLGKTVDYLDNRVYDDFEDSIWVSATNYIVEIFGSFLVEKGFERGSEVSNFKFVDVAFGWKFKGAQNLDCGVFVMMHMMFYAGKLFTSELHDPLKRIIYRAEIAAILVLADINQERDKLLPLVEAFTKVKAPLLPVLIEKRKLAELEAKRAEADDLEAARMLAEALDNGEETPAPGKKMMSAAPTSAGMIRSARGSFRRPDSDGLGCSLNCGKADRNLVVVSKVMRANSRFTHALPSLKKQVVDYCFLDDYKLANDELLFSAGDAILDRSDILSTKLDDYTELRVICAWSVVLNYMEVKEKEAPMMMFLGTQHMGIFEDMLEQGRGVDVAPDSQKDKVMRFWNRFLGQNVVNSEIDVDLVFIPLSLGKHYFCVCVNFMNKTIDVLDHTLHDLWEKSDFYRLAKIAVDCFSDFLDTRKTAKEGILINTFTFVNVDFEWKTNDMNDKESGFFIMFHMLTYEGKHVKDMTSVKKKIERIPIWIEMVAIMMMSDVNDSRASVLEEVGILRQNIADVEKEVLKDRRTGMKRFKTTALKGARRKK